MTTLTQTDEAIVGRIEAAGERIKRIQKAASAVIFGQEQVIERTLVTILSGGHALLIGVPGLAKTLLVETLGKIWDTFMAEMMAEPDPMCAGAKLGDNLVITWSGDTPKTPNAPNGWGDGTPQNSNWIYVLGNGYLKAGWFGQVKADNTIETFNAASGTNVAGGQSAAMAGPAGAAVLYAVARGDMRRVNGVLAVLAPRAQGVQRVHFALGLVRLPREEARQRRGARAVCSCAGEAATERLGDERHDE